MLEFRGQGVESAQFVSPDRDITLPFHCHVDTHEGVGMHGEIVEKTGSLPDGSATATIVRLASWADMERTALAPHAPEPTDVVVRLKTD